MALAVKFFPFAGFFAMVVKAFKCYVVAVCMRPNTVAQAVYIITRVFYQPRFCKVHVQTMLQAFIKYW